MAAEKDFSITIVGYRQDHEDGRVPSGRWEKPALPVVFYPVAIVPPNDYPTVLQKPSDHQFYVVIRNERNAPMELNMAASSWWECLDFKITDRSGSSYFVKRKFRLWAGNSLRPWFFPSNGMRILAVDFTNGSWEGLPSGRSGPRLATITASFHYGKATISSEPTEISLCAD